MSKIKKIIIKLREDGTERKGWEIPVVTASVKLDGKNCLFL